MKISSFHKMQGDDVRLLLDYDSVSVCDKVYLSKVFTDTAVPDFVLKAENVQYGGTGFYYDKAPKLPQEIEHIMPDYHLYDDWLASHIVDGVRGGVAQLQVLHRLLDWICYKRLLSQVRVLREPKLHEGRTAQST